MDPNLLQKSDLMSDTAIFVEGTPRHRYLLTRSWIPIYLEPSDAKVVCWVMLNPSKADGQNDDPTIRTCIGFSKKWGFHALIVVNIFSAVSTDPRGLLTSGNPEGPQNIHWVEAACRLSDLIVCAWGAHGEILDQGRRYKDILSQKYDLYCLAQTNQGQPGHPLYVSREKELEIFSRRKESVSSSP